MNNENWYLFDSQYINLLSPNEAYNNFAKQFKKNFDQAFIINNNENKQYSGEKITTMDDRKFIKIMSEKIEAAQGV